MHHTTFFFFSAESFGFFAYFFEDLNNHQYLIAKQPSGGGVDVEAKTKRATSEADSEEVLVQQTDHFFSLQQVVSTSWGQIAKALGRRLRRTAHLYFALQVLQQFREVTGSLPDFECQADVEGMLGLRARCLQLHGLPDDSLPLELLRNIISAASCSFPPVCAVFGGLLAQEILKAISHKDLPHKNFVLYNAHEGEAVVADIHP